MYGFDVTKYFQLFQQTTNPPSTVTEEPDAVITDSIIAISESIWRNGLVTGQELAETTLPVHPAASEDKAVSELNWFIQKVLLQASGRQN